MSEPVAELVEPVRRRRSPRTLAIMTLLLVAALAALWRFNPAETDLPLCALHSSTGLHCPGCGATRATHQLLHGRLPSALHHNALWILGLPLFLYALASEVCYTVRGRPLPGNLAGRPWFAIALVTIALLFGVLRNVPVYPLTLLAPPL